jgi:uncharacterized membrane protein YsdA (DUF1294 family)
MPDILIKCSDCGRRFTWSVGEQHFYRQRGLNQPKYCPACRERRKRERQASGQSSGSGRWGQAASASKPRSIPITQRLANGWRNPFYRFGLLSLGLTLLLVGVGAIGLTGFSGLGLVAAWLLAINLITLLVYRYDKFIAGRQQTRVPELVLLGLALIGGSLGGYLAMYLFRKQHKTKNPGFLIAFWAIVALQIVGLVFYFGI